MERVFKVEDLFWISSDGIDWTHRIVIKVPVGSDGFIDELYNCNNKCNQSSRGGEK